MNFQKRLSKLPSRVSAALAMAIRNTSDHLAVEAVRIAMKTIQRDATLVIGKGEQDEAPLLSVGEKLRREHQQPHPG